MGYFEMNEPNELKDASCGTPNASGDGAFVIRPAFVIDDSWPRTVGLTDLSEAIQAAINLSPISEVLVTSAKFEASEEAQVAGAKLLWVQQQGMYECKPANDPK